MRGLEWKTVLGAVIAASGLIVGTGAQAHDDDRWRWERWHGHHYWHHEPERRVVVEREVIERRPVYVAPAPVMMVPMAPAYSGYSGNSGPPSLNLNFNIPLQ